jgi:2-octaprenylphenol hydroxylase
MPVAEIEQFDVVIIGSGIAGSALAAALSGHGLALALVEAQTLTGRELPTAGGLDSFDARVSALTPKSQSLLTEVGCWDAIRDYRCCPYTHMTVWDAEGTGEIEFDSAEVDVPVLGHIVENRVVVDALLNKVRAATDITLFSPVRLQDCVVNDEGPVDLALDDGRQLRADLVVAADGAMSPVRQMLNFKTREWDYGHSAVVCTVEVERAHQDTAWQRFTPQGPLAFLPLPELEGRHYCSIVWSLQEQRAEEVVALTDEEFCRQLGLALENRLGVVLAASSRFAFPLRQRHAVDYVKPGVALVADAAHTIHPLAGQGINLGLQDVAVLSQEILKACERGGNPGSMAVLSRYQRRRKGENLVMMAAMDSFKRLFEQDALPLRWLRNAGMRTVAKLGPIKQQLMRHAMGLG